ncbi:hypothetical protein PYCCODRAFT_1437514 [Trametes coccinea BRFM310]|uniref:SMODS and SLOG-associating 2TM effector domain-containing protein n=1 Tax=Trametes coccinea (strain BRFM310) TaxID=1353009 RepID=A0A1Y2IKF1_TRAC3|nr:hypothetical protein PYCCODRAFT_1437514 [Trametes coccinea BRFM310]
MDQSSSHEAPAASPAPHPSAQGAATYYAAAASEPHASHEDLQHQPALSGTQTTSFRKPVPLPPVPIFAPPPGQMHDSPEQNPAGSPPHTPSILRMPSPNFPAGTAQAHHDHSSSSANANANAIAGPSNLAKQKQVASPNHSSEEDNAQTPGSEHSAGRTPRPGPHRSASGNGQSYGMPSTGYAGLPPSAPVQYPTRAASIGRPPQRQSRSIILTEPPFPPQGGQDLAELNPAGLMSQPSVIDHVVPTLPLTPQALGTNGLGRRVSVAATSQATLANGEKKVEDRLRPTLKAAMEERDRVALKAKAHAWALNVAIGAQVVLGALTTGVAAATSGRQTSIATSVLGGMSTLAASYLAKARGSGEPEVSYIRLRDLESFIRDCEAYMLDKGSYAGHEYDNRVERYRRRFEEIMGNGSGGVGDQVQSQSRGQAQGQSHLQREKIPPV